MTVRYVSPVTAEVYNLIACVVLIPVVWSITRLSSLGQFTWSPPAALWGLVSSSLSVAACIAYFFAIRNSQVYVVAGVTAAYPLLTMLLCWAFLGEQVTTIKAIGALIVVVGTVLLSL